MFAGHKKMNTLCVLVDNNGISQMGKINDICSPEPLRAKLESFNFEVLQVDGQNEAEIMSAITQLGKSEKPLAIVCRTTKGYGVSFMQSTPVWHYRPPAGIDYENAVKELEAIPTS